MIIPSGPIARMANYPKTGQAVAKCVGEWPCTRDPYTAGPSARSARPGIRRVDRRYMKGRTGVTGVLKSLTESTGSG
jgi:hypothetical protein